MTNSEAISISSAQTDSKPFLSKGTRAPWSNGWLQVWGRECVRWAKDHLVFPEYIKVSQGCVYQRIHAPTKRSSTCQNGITQTSISIIIVMIKTHQICLNSQVHEHTKTQTKKANKNFISQLWGCLGTI